MRNRRLRILLGTILLLGAAFLLLDFRLAVSDTGTEKLIMTTGMGENLPAPMQRRDQISLVLTGEGPLVSALQQVLPERLKEAGLGEVVIAQGLEPSYPNPVLVVKVGRPLPLWTPIFARSEIAVRAGYASDGDTTFMAAAEATHTSVGKQEVSNLYAELDISDRSLGLISRPGYYRHLAEALAREIVAALKSLYKI